MKNNLLQNYNAEDKDIKIDKPLLKPKNDVIFQCLFSKDNQEVTRNFIQSLLGKK